MLKNLLNIRYILENSPVDWKRLSTTETKRFYFTKIRHGSLEHNNSIRQHQTRSHTHTQLNQDSFTLPWIRSHRTASEHETRHERMLKSAWLSNSIALSYLTKYGSTPLTCLDLACAEDGPFFLNTVTVSQSLSAIVSR